MPSRFVILGVQRSGTTWIRTTLDSHPSILALGEVFLYSHGRLPFRRAAGLDVGHSYRQFIQDSPHRRLQHVFNRAGVVTDYLDKLYTQPAYDAIGFKLMRTHCRQFPSVVDYLLKEQVLAIHVVRQNVLKTLISRETARQRKLFHTHDSVPPKKIAIDVPSLLPALGKIASENKAWEHMFRKGPYIQVSYESFISDRETELRRIYNFLSVAPDITVSSTLVKINPDAIKDVLLNYEEVYQALKGTSFAPLVTQ